MDRAFAAPDRPTSFDAKPSSLRAVAVAAIILALAGCATQRQASSASPSHEPSRTKPRPAAAPTLTAPARQMQQETVRPTLPPDAVPVPPSLPPRESPAGKLRKLLPENCVVAEATPTMLLVHFSRPAESPALFEEAIALSRLRGVLNATSSLPKDTASRTKLQNGTATIPLPDKLSPGTQADIVLAALDVQGIQKVRVILEPR